MRKLTLAALAAAVAVLIGVGAATAGNTSTIVGVGTTPLGHVLVDAHGKTLYLWAHDRSRRSTCNGDCAEYWSPLIANGTISAIRGANQMLIGTSRRSDGRLQVTYAGHPLYSFVQDVKPGQIKGEGLTGFGGRWDPVSITGSAVQKRSTSDDAYGSAPLKAIVISPAAGESAGVGGTFTVDLSLEARTASSNGLLAGYTAAFNDPNAPTFHPGPNAAAPGLVVLLSTTPTIAGTPLQGPNTNLAGVFQINDVGTISGLRHTFNSWIVTVPGFFGQGDAGNAHRLRGERHRTGRRDRRREADLERRPRELHDRGLIRPPMRRSRPARLRLTRWRQPDMTQLDLFALQFAQRLSTAWNRPTARDWMQALADVP